jgi:hypothetical protein
MTDKQYMQDESDKITSVGPPKLYNTIHKTELKTVLFTK